MTNPDDDYVQKLREAHPMEKLQAEITQLRGNLSLAEDGLASYALEVERLKDALEMLYDKWEEGAPCFEDADNTGISLGNAFRLTEDEEAKILALIPSRRSTPKADAVRLPNTLCPRCHQFHFEVEDTETGCIQLLMAVVRKLRLAQPREPEGGK